jgi:uncharacterized protein YwgA
MLNNIDLLLLTFYYNDNVISGRKRLQKIICVLKNKYKIDFSYQFIPYYYGPFSNSLSNTLDILIDSGLIEETQLISNNILKYNYILTEKGKILASKLVENNEVPIELHSYVDELKNKTTPELVKLSKEVSGLY